MDFRMVWNIELGESDFKNFMWWSNPLVVAAEKFGRNQTLSPLHNQTMCKDLEEQLNLLDPPCPYTLFPFKQTVQTENLV